MKKILFLLIVLFASGAAKAQNPLIFGDFNRDGKITVNDISHIINMANGQENLKEVKLIDGRMELVDYDPIFHGHDYVNLGLTDEQGDTIYWATCNVGAEKPEDYGRYYAWAETEPCTEVSWEYWKYYDVATEKYLKYTYYVDGKSSLDDMDDVAHVEWGGAWRLPTRKEQDQLRENCVWTWTTLNGVNGYKIESKVNDNWIFLPTAGYLRNKNDVQNVGTSGYYRSKDRDQTYVSRAYIIYFDASEYRWGNPYHIFGDSVRPVCVKSK